MPSFACFRWLFWRTPSTLKFLNQVRPWTWCRAPINKVSAVYQSVVFSSCRLLNYEILIRTEIVSSYSVVSGRLPVKQTCSMAVLIHADGKLCGNGNSHQTASETENSRYSVNWLGNNTLEIAGVISHFVIYSQRLVVQFETFGINFSLI